MILRVPSLCQELFLESEKREDDEEKDLTGVGLKIVFFSLNCDIISIQR